MCIKMYVWLHLHVTSLIFIHIEIKMVKRVYKHVRGVIIKMAITLSVDLAIPVDASLLSDHPLLKH